MDLSAALEFLRAHNINLGVNNALVAWRALERGIRVQGDAKGRVRMRAYGRTMRFKHGWTNLNPRIVGRCTVNKDVTSRLLRPRGVRAPENAFFGADDIKRAWAWAEPILPVVVKPSNSTKGRLVYVGITDVDDFGAAFASVAEVFGGALVEEFVPGVEHRVTVVGGAVVAATRRVAANVVGDGGSTVGELVAEKNRQRADGSNPIHKYIALDSFADRELTRQGLTLQSVPSAGQRVFLRATTNLHTGGDAVDATDALTPVDIQLVERAARALPGLKLGGFDVLRPPPGDAGEPCVLEVNMSPMLSMHHYPWEGQPREVASRLIDVMYPETADKDHRLE
ncbi:hypothetical protein [Phytoactinopolyspora limicola]|uniref:hypothetical protein n=1 Tax=Phytoactinopolyspora limicola TaxID=2715536 RepID=UPI001407D603|nr:hypothetical protein [Phytoactinopolyspora limicola]